MLTDMTLHVVGKNFAKQRTRDSQIMRFLAAGPATFKGLHTEFFRREDGELADPRVARRRLTKLINMGYLKHKRYQISDRGIDIYALDELGANAAFYNWSLDRDCVRMDFPSNHTVNHDLILSDVIRKVWQGSDEKNYDLKIAFDDRVMKSRHALEMRFKDKVTTRRKYYYPDLFMIIQQINQPEKSFNIEIDCGQKGKSYWVPKITSWNRPTLVLTLTLNRMKAHKAYALMSDRKHIMGFATVDDFLKNGLIECEWDWLDACRENYPTK